MHLVVSSGHLPVSLAKVVVSTRCGVGTHEVTVVMPTLPHGFPDVVVIGNIASKYCLNLTKMGTLLSKTE